MAETRETNSSLEVSRESLERQLASKEAELEKARITMCEMEREVNTLKDRCSRYGASFTPCPVILAHRSHDLV